MHSTNNVSPLHQTFHASARGTALTLLSVLLWLFPVRGAAQIPGGFATVGPPAHLDLAPAVRVITAGDDTTTNDSTVPATEVPFRPTMDQSVYDALKADASATAPDAARRPPRAAAGRSAPIVLNKNFEGVNQTQAFGPGSGFFPPDTHGAIGTTQFVEIVNTAFVVYDRDSGDALKRVSLNELFGYPVPPVGQFIVDPRAAYDRAADRFVITGVAFPESPDVEFFFIGVSETPDATGAFLVQQVNVRQPPFMSNGLFDYPILGIGADGVFVTSNIFAPGFVGADLVVFAKAPLYAGQGGTITVFTGLLGTLTPPMVLDQNNSSFLLANLPNTPFVAIYQLTGAGDPATTTLSDPFTIVVPTYRIPRSARQPGSFATLDTLDTRFVNASTQVGASLFNVHTIAFETLPTPRWYELDVTARTAAQTGVFFGKEESDDWNASIVVNDTRDAFVTWSSSNASGSREDPPYFVQVRTSGRLSTEPPGVIPAGVVVFQSATPYFFFRWGDYSAITLDPTNASCTWGVNEKVNATSVWGSRFFSGCQQ